MLPNIKKGSGWLFYFFISFFLPTTTTFYLEFREQDSSTTF